MLDLFSISLQNKYELFIFKIQLKQFSINFHRKCFSSNDYLNFNYLLYYAFLKQARTI